jgi:hypothetical protein
LGRLAGRRARCFPDAAERSPCRSFNVQCRADAGCVCPGESCPFRFASSNLTPILEAMRAVLPQLRPEQVEIGYRTNGLGYVGRPIPVPVDIELRLVGLTYSFPFFGPLAGWVPALRASASLPGEDLASD